MNQKQVTLTVVLSIIAAVAVLSLTNKFIANEENLSAEIEQVEVYPTDFDEEADKLLSDEDAVDFTRDPELSGAGRPQLLQE